MAADEGVAFMKSKEGIVRLATLIFLCAAFILIAVAGYSGVIIWVLATYIFSWILSLQSYVFIAIGVAGKIECGISFDDVDIVLSVFSFFSCLLASFTLAIYARATNLWIVACIFGFIASVLYAVELCLLEENPPLNFKYLIGRNGLVKSSIVIVGCASFVLLYVSGFRCVESIGCDAGRIFVLVIYILCWSLSTIFLFIRLIDVAERFGYFELVDMFWSGFSFLCFLIASIVLANYLQCVTFTDFDCGTRLGSVILGFYVSILYFVDTVLLKRKFGRVLDKNVFVPKQTAPSYPAPVKKSTRTIKV